MTAPSSKNTRSTRILVTDKPEIMAGIAGMRSTGTAFAADAPLAFVVMGDQEQTDLWMVNSAISATVLQFAAEDEGLGTCWMQVEGRPHHNEAPGGISAEEYLHGLIPETKPYRILGVVPAGCHVGEAKPHSVRDDSDKVIFITE